MTTKSVSVLGSTGSVGVQTLEVIEKYSDLFCVKALSGWTNVRLLLDQCRRFKPQTVAVADNLSADDLDSLRAVVPEVLTGKTGPTEIASRPCDVLVVAIGGIAGLEPVLKASEQGYTIALANKESVVCGGDLLMRTARRTKARIIPVDSEHSAIFQCLKAGNKAEIERIILTASGGPFRGSPLDELWGVTVKQALAHPTWRMGKKISIDSATMMNKGLEIIEAHHLFDVPYDKIEVAIHPQSVVHSMVEFVDGSMVAQMGAADMRIPIQYALTYPGRLKGFDTRFSVFRAGSLGFYKPEPGLYPLLELAYDAGRSGGLTATAMSSANEHAVNAFLHERIHFPEVANIVSKVVNKAPKGYVRDLKDIIEVDIWARSLAEAFVRTDHKVE